MSDDLVFDAIKSTKNYFGSNGLEGFLSVVDIHLKSGPVLGPDDTKMAMSFHGHRGSYNFISLSIVLHIKRSIYREAGIKALSWTSCGVENGLFVLRVNHRT